MTVLILLFLTNVTRTREFPIIDNKKIIAYNGIIILLSNTLSEVEFEVEACGLPDEFIWKKDDKLSFISTVSIEWIAYVLNFPESNDFSPSQGVKFPFLTEIKPSILYGKVGYAVLRRCWRVLPREQNRKF